jgi:hypothetical protein
MTFSLSKHLSHRIHDFSSGDSALQIDRFLATAREHLIPAHAPADELRSVALSCPQLSSGGTT